MGRIELIWNPTSLGDPGPCIDVIVRNSQQVIEAGRAAGLEFPKDVKLKALLDTGASVTVISKVFANHCKLFQTSEGSEITALGATHKCGEHAGCVSFPGTDLKPFDTIRIISAEFVKQRHYACLVGRDILRHWEITFDGKSNRVTIFDKR
jgi:predicted aspartyl protease